jgi:hypothetical protein
VLHYLPHIAIALIVLAAFATVWRAEGDDPLWLARWDALTPEERIRLARAARSGTLLPSQEEIELAAGFARRDRRRRRPGRLIASLDVPAGAAILLGGLVSGIFVFSAFGFLILGLGLLRLLRARRVSRGLRETIARDHRP